MANIAKGLIRAMANIRRGSRGRSPRPGSNLIPLAGDFCRERRAAPHLRTPGVHRAAGPHGLGPRCRPGKPPLELFFGCAAVAKRHEVSGFLPWMIAKIRARLHVESFRSRGMEGAPRDGPQPHGHRLRQRHCHHAHEHLQQHNKNHKHIHRHRSISLGLAVLLGTLLFDNLLFGNWYF